MLKTTKKILGYTAITSILNLSFQPAYAGKSDLHLASEEISYTQKVSHHLTKKALHKERVSDFGLEDPQTNFTRMPQTPEEDVVSLLFLAPLKIMTGAVSLLKQGVRFTLENPGQAITMGLLLQARAVTSTLSLGSLTPSQGFTIIGVAENDQSGYSVSSAGDFNGDGLNDLIIGAPNNNNGIGKSYVIYGTNSTPPSINLSSLTPIQGFTITGAAVGDLTGCSVSSAGDFNGDGLSDIIIGAWRANNFAGKSYVIYGTNGTPPSINLSSLTPIQGFTITGAAANPAPPDESGWSVSSAGDFNGDGLSDVIIGAPDAGSIGKSYVIYGTNSTPPSISLSSLTLLEGFTINGAGQSVSSAGDFNGDGFNDVIIGAPYANSDAGNSYVIYGTKTPPPSISLSSLTPLEGFNITGVAASLSGYSVASAGDFNGDGFNDVIIGAPYAGNIGKSYVIYGTNSIPPSISLSSLTLLEGFTINGAGQSVSSAGDFNNDGLNDLIIGADGVNNYAGNSYVIYGRNSTPPSISLSSLTPLEGFTITGAAKYDESGYSVSSAGDFNHDGLNDLIIGAPQIANLGAGKSYVIYGISTPSSISLSSLTASQGINITGAAANDYSGVSVSSAGDFNGDGLGDVIIGADGANSFTGNTYLIYGTNRTPPSISLNSLMPNQGFAITGANISDYSGRSASSAGDFNGDGLSDVIIGAPQYNTAGTGSSYVIYGTNSKFNSISLNSLTPIQGFTITGAAQNDYSGASVSSAGDFNGDGLGDVVIGAWRANNYTGSSYLIYGTKILPSSISLGSLTPVQGFTITGAAVGDKSGFSVSSAGDFNGDGFNDLIIGAYAANGGAGNSYVIYGTNSKPSSISLSSLAPNKGFIISGAAANDYSGWSVSSAGDFNGDGLGDVVIGAWNATTAAGKSYLIYGTNRKPSSISLSSLTPNQGFTITGASVGDESGFSVSSAGDFNDDGLNDLIIGAPYTNNRAGNSYVIYGTNSTPPSISLSRLTPLQGLIISGANTGDYSGASVSSAGDFNDDGLNDLIIGASGANGGAGNSYVIYGVSASSSTSPSMMITSGETSTTPKSQISSMNTALSSIIASSNLTSEDVGTSVSTSRSKISSIVPISSSSIITLSNPTSESESSRMTSSSTRASISPSSSPFSPPAQHSSSGNSNGMSWETIAAIGGGVGGAVVAGVIGGIIVKKCCFSTKKEIGYTRLENLEEGAETPTT